MFTLIQQTLQLNSTGTDYSQTWNAMPLLPTIGLAIVVAIFIAAILVLGHAMAMYRLGQTARHIITSVKYFLTGGVIIGSGYGLYTGLTLLVQLGAGGDPIVLLQYAGYAVGGYVGIAGFGYIMARLFRAYRGNLKQFKIGLLEKKEAEQLG